MRLARQAGELNESIEYAEALHDVDAPMPHFRDEWRNLSLPRVDEDKDKKKAQ